MYREIHIYDIDGTLVDSTHRYRTITKDCGSLAIDLPYWVENRHRAMNDTLLPLARQYQEQRHSRDIFTVLATARVMSPAEWRHIETRLGMPDFFISRLDGDAQSGTTLKIEGLKKLFAKAPDLRYALGTFYEDNQDYLNGVADFFGFDKVFVPSNQGY